MSAILDLFRAFRDAEQAWIQSFQTPPANTDHPTPSSSALQDCSLHYGELAFVLAGLKPCLLIQLPTPELTTAFYKGVLLPHLLDHPAYDRLSAPSDLGLSCQLITGRVRSPEMSLQGYVLLWSRRTVLAHPQADLIQRGIDRVCPQETSVTSRIKTGRENGRDGQEAEEEEEEISEEDLAVMLDIPGRLPRTHSEMLQMIEVSYWHHQTSTNQTSNNQTSSTPETEPTLLTAFAAQPDQIPEIHAHFRRYRDTVLQVLGLPIKLHIQSMADMVE
ncbi:hypothetical protein KVV02_006199 [Mortierella alpina]|uniref:Uncharacterized protein n=1 Tax=Mortierella alpina TaxID=64518 RepID=A0A9P8AAK7_MORAP|nr:hypothetical protein KVV02_006199 [Mortierella alpina]